METTAERLTKTWDQIQANIDRHKNADPELFLPYAIAKLEHAVNKTIFDISKIDISFLKKTVSSERSAILNQLTDGSTITLHSSFDSIFIEYINSRKLEENFKTLKTMLSQDSKPASTAINKLIDYKSIRNSLIHHDLFKKYKLKNIAIPFNDRYIFDQDSSRLFIETINTYIGETKKSIIDTFSEYNDHFIIKKYWDFIFDEKYKLKFEECWNTFDIVTYIGPMPDEYVKHIGSPRTACLLSLFLSNFGYGNIIHYQDILCLQEAERDKYLKKFSMIVELHKLLDLQTMKLNQV